MCNTLLILNIKMCFVDVNSIFEMNSEILSDEETSTW